MEGRRLDWTQAKDFLFFLDLETNKTDQAISQVPNCDEKKIQAYFVWPRGKVF